MSGPVPTSIGRRAATAVVGVVILASTACSGTHDGAPGTSPGPELGPVSVTSGLRYATEVPSFVEWMDPVLDVYAPAGASALPLVVLLPAHGLTSTSSPAYEQFASAVAARGAVVVVADWSQREDPPESFTDPAALQDLVDTDRAIAGCAVAYAVAHAADYGADPARLVLAGELYGANMAGLIALEAPPAYPSCIVDSTWQARGLLGLDGDWLAGMPAFDAIPVAAVGSLTPWPLLPSPEPHGVVLAVAESAAEATRTCAGSEPPWLVDRDPDGTLRRWVGSVGALEDGCIDVGDGARALAAAIDDAGTPATVLELDNDGGGTTVDPGGHLGRLGEADLAALVDATLGLAG